MPAPAMQALTLAFFTLAIASGASAQTLKSADAERYLAEKRQANNNVVTIIGSQAATTYTTFVEDIQNVMESVAPNDLRVLPLLGKGGGQNLHDIMFLRCIDMGLVDQDAPQYFEKKDPEVFSNIRQRLHYIAKLSNSELQVFVRRNINALADLRGQKVSFHKPLSSSAIAAETLFKTAGVEVAPVYADTNVTVQMFREGKIAGMVRVSGAPHPLFAGLTEQDGHFLSLARDSLPPGVFERLMMLYLPATLSNVHYPNLILADNPVETFSNATVLAVYAWPENSERYTRIKNFINIFFSNIGKFHADSRHQKWNEVNIAADVPGWTRFAPAQQWIENHRASHSYINQNIITGNPQ